MRNIIEDIRENYNELTKSQRKIADFVMENYTIIPFENLKDIAARIGMSTTSLIRFARALGYENYSDLKRGIQEQIKVKMSLPARLDNALKEEVQPNEILNKCRELSIRNINETIKYMDKDQLESAINLICGTEGICYVLGLRSCFSPAFFTAMVLSQINSHTRLIQGIGNIYLEEIVDVKDGDIVIVFSFPRFYKETLNLANFMKRKGAKIILITSNQYEHIKQYGDIILPCYTKGMSFKDSFVAVFFLIDYIISEVSYRNKKKGLKVISKLEEILSQNYFIGF